MKVILYMAITLNGLIAKEDDTTSWISKAEWDSYSAAVREAGHLIIGRRTYHILTKQPEFAEFEKVKIVAVSGQDFETVSPLHTVAHSPQEALAAFQCSTRVVVAGGGGLNASFLGAGLIDEVFIDVEPTLLAKGIPLLHGTADFEISLKLLGVRSLSDSEVQLHYSVNK